MSEMRLQRFLARAGVASRRHAEELITSGHVSVNGEVVDTLGTKVNPGYDEVAVDGEAIPFNDEHTTLMLHKPAGYITAMSDSFGHACVSQLVPTERYTGLFPVGRLDADTTGLLLFTTDGQLGNALLHPRYEVGKHYFACVEGVPTKDELERLRAGVELDDGPTQPAEVSLFKNTVPERVKSLLDRKDSASAALRKKLRTNNHAYVSLTIHEGRNRQVKRMCEAIGHPVLALHRDRFAGLELGDLKRGEWRELTEQEQALLKGAAGIED